MTKKTVLVSPPAGDVRRGENLGIRYLASFLSSHGHKAEIVEADLDRIDTAGVVSRVSGFDFVGFSLNYNQQYPAAKKIVAELVEKERAGGRMAKKTIVAGGHYATFQADFVLSDFPEVDAIVLGEGEHTLLKLLESGRERLASVANIAYRGGDGSVQRTEQATGISNIDSYPFPRRDQNSAREGYTMISSRGCYAKCSFCSVAAFSKQSGFPKKWLSRSPENIIEEIVDLREKLGVDAVSFVDDVFVGPDEKSRQRAFSFCELVREQGIDIRFFIACRADAVERRLFEKLVSVGLKGACVGFESGQDKALGCFNKKISADENDRAIEVLRQLDIDGDHGFILFYPEMEYGDFLVNLDFLYRSGLLDSRLLCSRLVILYGTPYFHRELDSVEVEDDGIKISYVFKDNRLERLHSALAAVHAVLTPVENKIANLTYYLHSRDDTESNRRYRQAVSSMRKITGAGLYRLAKDLFHELEDGGVAGDDYVLSEARRIAREAEGVADFTRAAAEGRLGDYIDTGKEAACKRRGQSGDRANGGNAVQSGQAEDK